MSHIPHDDLSSGETVLCYVAFCFLLLWVRICIQWGIWPVHVCVCFMLADEYRRYVAVPQTPL